MNDLFDPQPDANPTQPNVRQVRRLIVPDAPDAASVPVAKLTGPDAASVPARRDTMGGPTRPTQRKSQKQDGATLRAERDLLRLQLADWRQSLDLRARALAPMQGAFLAAHEKAADVAALYGPPPRECPMARARVLEAYEVRRKAGMAAHPYRQAAAEAERVVKGISARIKEINAELEHG